VGENAAKGNFEVSERGTGVGEKKLRNWAQAKRARRRDILEVCKGVCSGESFSKALWKKGDAQFERAGN